MAEADWENFAYLVPYPDLAEAPAAGDVELFNKPIYDYDVEDPGVLGEVVGTIYGTCVLLPDAAPALNVSPTEAAHCIQTIDYNKKRVAGFFSSIGTLLDPFGPGADGYFSLTGGDGSFEGKLGSSYVTPATVEINGTNVPFMLVEVQV